MWHEEVCCLLFIIKTHLLRLTRTVSYLAIITYPTVNLEKNRRKTREITTLNFPSAHFFFLLLQIIKHGAKKKRKRRSTLFTCVFFFFKIWRVSVVSIVFVLFSNFLKTVWHFVWKAVDTNRMGYDLIWFFLCSKKKKRKRSQSLLFFFRFFFLNIYDIILCNYSKFLCLL